MSLREQVTTAALLGASRPLEATGSALDSFLDVLAKREPPQRILDTIALVIAYEEAGAMPLAGPKLDPASAVDPRPICGPTASGHLATLLADRKGLLPEWLALLKNANLRLPEEFVPALLDAATADRSIRENVLATAGPLAVWLSRYRSEWSWVHAPVLDDSVWETATLGERLAILQQLRSTDPARARELVEATWQSESADTRRQLLEPFVIGRTLADEDFLESSLEDRSVVVRRAAAEHLSAIADSKLSQRMFARLSGRLQMSKTGFLGRTKVIEVTPFETADADMVRDGIEKKPPTGSTLGERAWWTAQALACVDPAIWTRELNADPAHLLEAARNGQWGDLLMEGWRTAAIRYRAADWLRAFAADAATRTPTTFAVFRAMTDDERESAMIRMLGIEPKTWLPQVQLCCNHAWSAKFTEVFLSTVDRNKPTEPADPLTYHLKPLLRAAASWASPQVESVPADAVFAEFTDILSFRRSIRQALSFTNRENE